MWFWFQNIFDYLNDESVLIEKKEKILQKKTKRVKQDFQKLLPSQILDYLFNSTLPESVKKFICDELDNLTSTEYDHKFLGMKNYYEKNNLYCEELLYLDYCPKYMKKKIIDEIFDYDVKPLICDKKTSSRLKKVLIEHRLSSYESIRLLSESLPREIIDFIIDNKINSNNEIGESIKKDEISEEIKDEIVIKKVNTSNMFNIIHLSFHGEKERVYRLKDKEIEEYILNLNSDNILEVINDYNTPEDFVERILLLKEKTIKEAISKCDKKSLDKVLYRSRLTSIVNMAVELRKDDTYQVLKEIDKDRLLYFLNQDNLSQELKEYILETHKDILDNAIIDFRESALGFEMWYLSNKASLPNSVKKRIFELRKDLFIERIKERTDSEIMSDLKYSSRTYSPLKELTIQMRVNESNIHELLSYEYLDEETLDLIIKNKNDILRPFLETIPFTKLIKLDINEFSWKAKEKILELNNDYVKENISSLTEEELYKYLSDIDVSAYVKKVILEKFNIKEKDVEICLQLIDGNNAQILLKNYNNITDFINKNNINLQAFLQYGSGSIKYANWLDNIIKIIDNNQIKEFIKCKDYFFNNYYDGLNEKENTVYVINSFLNLIENFNKYNELCISLSKNNISLSEEDKLSLNFLFNIKDLNGINPPTSLKELKEFKTKLYDGYINKINSKDTEIEEIKEIINSLLFCNSDYLFNSIGGTKTLISLKKDNENSLYITSLINELILYSKVIEQVRDTDNITGLKNILNIAFKDIDTLTKFQNMFSSLDTKVNKVFELDAKNHLTSLEKVKSIDGVLNLELSKEYGGEVYDFSNSNYVLYAHVLSSREKIESLINGESNGQNNFISISPISYKGQKYYWDRGEFIIAYDKIPNGSFVCSSIKNMGSNYSIKKNSSEIGDMTIIQRGILETSAVTKNNSEVLLYREGLKACGLILPGGRKPTKAELEYHQKYNLPFIITQEAKQAIDKPEVIFERSDNNSMSITPKKELEDIIKLIDTNTKRDKENDIYTGKEIAIITDCHSMYEPTLVALEAIRRRGIEEIYSLGDNIGLGPNPKEVFDLLEEYNVKSVAGNSEYYAILGTESFPYFYREKKESQDWTEEQLGKSRIKKLKLYPASIDLFIGDKKIALCHFANDVRWDFRKQSTHTYQANFTPGESSKQFLYTNSNQAKKKVVLSLADHPKGDERMKGYQSSKDSPIFEGKKVTDYDAIIQGHVHFDRRDFLDETKIYTLRAVGMGYEDDPTNSACYYVLKEKKDGDFDLEKVLVPFNKNLLISDIHNSGVPNKDSVLEYVITPKDRKK